MKGTKFGNLTSLVLVDTLAVLPMEHVVRMARLGHERLHQTCSLKWVTDRMTDVTFGTIVSAHLTGGDIAAAFCTKFLMRRLNGRVTITGYDCKHECFMEACVELVKQVPGILHLCQLFPKAVTCPSIGPCQRCENFEAALAKQTNLTYSSVTYYGALDNPLIGKSPSIVFEYEYSRSEVEVDGNVRHDYNVFYRPALLNSRHIVDLLRAVCGRADVSEAELNRVRREATRLAGDTSWMEDDEMEGVWDTSWDTAVTSEVL